MTPGVEDGSAGRTCPRAPELLERAVSYALDSVASVRPALMRRPPPCLGWGPGGDGARAGGGGWPGRAVGAPGGGRDPRQPERAADRVPRPGGRAPLGATSAYWHNALERDVGCPGTLAGMSCQEVPMKW